MAVREIKTTLELDGEKQFKQAIAGANKQLRVMDSELRAAAAAFASTGDDQSFMTTKTRILNEELEQQREIARALKGALDSVNDKFGEGSDEAQDWAIKLNNAQAKISKLEKELKDAEKELDDVDDGFEDAGKEAKTFARNLDRYATDATEDAEKAMRGLEDQLGDLGSALDSIKGSAEFQVGVQLAEGAWDAVTGLFDYTEEARDYNRQLAMLEQNAANAKIDFSTAETEAFEAAAYIGDLDSALEGVNELLAAGLDTTQFVQGMDLLTGAALRFPDTLKFESLADGLQETLATGQGSGQFAELLERLGVDMDEFNTGLAAAKTNGTEVDYVLTYLSQHGLADQKRVVGETNKSMIEGEASTLRLQKAWMRFGEAIDPVLTKLKNFGALQLETLADWFGGAETIAGYDREEFLRDLGRKSGGAVGWHDEGDGIIRTDFGAAFANIWNGLTGGANSEELSAVNTELETMRTRLENLYNVGYGGLSEGQLESIWYSVETQKKLEEEAGTAATDAETAGANIAAGIAAGITDGTDAAIAAANALAAGVQAELNKIAVPSFVISGYTAGAAARQQPLNVNVNLNGRKLGQTIAPIINQQLGLAK